MAAYPAVQFLEDPFYSRKTEVIDPAPKYRSQHSNGSPDGATFTSPEQHLELALKPLDRLTGHLQTHVAFPLAYGIAQKGSLPGAVYRTLFLIDPQLQPGLQELSHRGQYPVSRPSAPDVDVAVIGIAAEAVTPSLQFPIQIGQQDIGQQWRQDSPNAKGNFEFDRVINYR